MHSYDNGPSTKTRANNWGQLKKLLLKRGLNVSHQLMDDVAAVRAPRPSSLAGTLARSGGPCHDHTRTAPVYIVNEKLMNARHPGS